MRRNCRIFTPENLCLVRLMAEQGGSAFEIAGTPGSTPGSVRVVCCRHKIKLKRGRRPAQHAPESTFGQTQPVTRRVVTAQMPEPIFVEFNRKAQDLHLSPSSLASSLLLAIAMSDIYEAVLDDRN
jgi:hypothetical protein